MNHTNEELIKLIQDGHFFYFCVAFALNKGYRDPIKEKKEVKFAVGDYDVTLDHRQMCFILINRIYIFRVIHAYHQEVVFIGQTEKEVINELLTELQKEFV